MGALVWLRSDLRDSWNSALDYAIENHQHVAVIYCLTPNQWDRYGYAPCKINLILNRLTALEGLLAKRGLPLHIIDSQTYRNTPEVLLAFCQANAISDLFFNADYEWDERQRDCEVKRLLALHNISVAKFHDTCLVKPNQILTLAHTPYKVFTPYFKKWFDDVAGNLPRPLVPSVSQQKYAPGASKIDFTQLQRQTRVSVWPYENQDILARLQRFIHEHAGDYGHNRDIPGVDGTSQMSAYLSIGAVSPAQCLSNLLQEYGDAVLNPSHGGYVWLKELAWRDFYRYVMYHFPHVSKGLPFQMHYRAFKWSNNTQHFDAWCNGHTGYPIVDAAMLALKQTGWMHNRLRMIVASFLCKHLLLPWHWGEKYFMSQLVDGDYASNNGGWQWSASVGTDAAPYFRIFNPTSQSERFDPKGEFIKAWLPQLRELSPKHIHQPAKYLDVKTIGYHEPIVDHRASVSRTKDQFKGFLATVVR